MNKSNDLDRRKFIILLFICTGIGVFFSSCFFEDNVLGGFYHPEEKTPAPFVTITPDPLTPGPTGEPPTPGPTTASTAIPSTPTSTPMPTADPGSSYPTGGPLNVVDHTCTDLSKIPEEWIEKARHLIVHSVGQSHSTQITNGLELLANQDPRFAYERVSKLDSPAPDKLIILGRQRNPGNTDWDTGYVGEEHYWATETAREMTQATASYAMESGCPFDVSIWFWCSVDIGREDRCYDEQGTLITFNDERRDTYFSSLLSFNQNYPHTTYVYVTSVTDVAADHNGWRVTMYNEDIRGEAERTGGILFDQAAIENWNMSNTEQRQETWEGHTLLLRHADYDEASGADSFAGDHTNDALCLKKAKAFWWLLARIAGWDGES